MLGIRKPTKSALFATSESVAENPCSKELAASLAEGDSVEEILKDFPTLKAEDVQAAIAFAAASAEEDLPVPEVPHIR